MKTETLEQTADQSTDTGGDGQAWEKRCGEVRDNIERMLRSASRSSRLLKDKDVTDYMKGITSQAMKEGGADSAKTEHDWLRQSEKEFVPLMIQKAQAYTEKFYNAISKAKTEGVLDQESVRKLENVLTRRSVSFDQVKAFFETTGSAKSEFDTWMENWASLGAVMKDVKALRKKTIILKGVVPSVDLLDTDAFRKVKVPERITMAKKAFEDLVKYEYGREKDFGTAKAMLRRAVEEGGLAPSKVDGWLAHIFAKPEAAVYVQHVLPHRVSDWIKDGQTYAGLQDRAKRAGIPCREPQAYVALSYKERRSETMKLKEKLDGIEKASHHPVLTQLQEALDLDAFDVAKNLATAAAKMSLSGADKKYLFDLNQQIDMELQASKGVKSGNAKSPEIEVLEKRAELEKELHKLPRELFEYYVWALREGGSRKWARMRRLRVWHYNIKWAHSHGFLPDEETYQKVKDGAEVDTQRIKEMGRHRQKGTEMLDIGDRSKEMDLDRPIASGKSKGATYMRFGEEDIDPLRQMVDDDLTSEKKNYWGLAVAEDVTLKRTIETYDPVANALKGLQGAEQAAGMQNDRIPVGYGTLENEVQHSMAA